VLPPPSFLDAVTYEKKLLYFHAVGWYIIIHLYYFYLQYCIVFNILFRYNTLFTYTSKNILLILVIILSQFLGPDKQLQVFECPVAVGSVIREDHLSSRHHGRYALVTANKSLNWNHIQAENTKDKTQPCLMFYGGFRAEGNI
jgi:hypothetical protein